MKKKFKISNMFALNIFLMTIFQIKLYCCFNWNVFELFAVCNLIGSYEPLKCFDSKLWMNEIFVIMKYGLRSWIFTLREKTKLLLKLYKHLLRWKYLNFLNCSCWLQTVYRKSILFSVQKFLITNKEIQYFYT